MGAVMDKPTSSVLQTIMDQEIQAISAAPPKVVSYNYKVIVHTPNGKEVPALIINYVGLLRDYYTRFGDVISLQASFPTGEVIHDILPNHTDLEITLIKIPLRTSSKYEEVTSVGNSVQRYTAKLYDPKSALLEGKQIEASSRGTASANNMMAIDFQLIPTTLEELRVKTFGSVIRETAPIDAIRCILMNHTPEVKGVTVEGGYSDKPKDHIVLSHLTRVVDTPKIINKLCGGIYPTGFKYYMQDSMWYIYSPYNITYYHLATTTLTIINLPKDKLSELEVTFRQTAGQTILLATGDTSHLDESEKAIQNQGNGFKFVDASKVMEDFGEIVDNKFVVDRTKNVTQVVNVHQQRKVNVVNESAQRFTSAYNLEYSEIMKRSGSLVQVVWEASEADLLYPGMPVRYMYMDTGQAKEVYGRVVATETQTRQTNRSVTQRIFTNDTVVTLFVSTASVSVNAGGKEIDTVRKTGEVVTPIIV